MSLPLMGAGKGTDGAAAWTPLSAAGLLGWWENDATKVFTDLGSTLATNGQHVQQLNDKSGNARNLTDGGNGSGAFPTWNTGPNNLSFDGGDVLLTPSTAAWVDGSGQLTIGFAGSLASVASTYAPMVVNDGGGGSADLLEMMVVSGVPTARRQDTRPGNTQATGAAITAAQNVRIIITSSSTTLTVYVNGVAGTPVTLLGTGRSGNSQVFIGTNVGVDWVPNGSKMVAAVAYSGVLGGSDITALDTYLAGRF